MCVCLIHSVLLISFCSFSLSLFTFMSKLFMPLIVFIQFSFSVEIINSADWSWHHITSRSHSLSLLFAAISDIDTDIFSLKTNQTPHSTKLIVWDVILMIAQKHSAPPPPPPNIIWMCVSVIFAMFSRFYGYWFCESWARKTIKFH